MLRILLQNYQSTDNEPVVTTSRCLPYHPPLHTGLVTHPSGRQSGTESDSMMPCVETLFHHAGSTHSDAVAQTEDSLAADRLQVVSKGRRFSTHDRHSNPFSLEFTNPSPSREMEPSNFNRKDLLAVKSGDKRNFLRLCCTHPKNKAANRREATIPAVMQYIPFLGSGLLTANTPRKCRKHHGGERTFDLPGTAEVRKEQPFPATCIPVKIIYTSLSPPGGDGLKKPPAHPSTGNPHMPRPGNRSRSLPGYSSKTPDATKWVGGHRHFNCEP